MCKHVLIFFKYVIEKFLLNVLIKIYGQIQLRLESITPQLGHVAFARLINYSSVYS